ncbi:unnamed protein product [Mytilus edulis]|uniref:Uncharacterized protein n=1 Tax=Mytilus edulis TaxID=6550 RepID=A0A8S3VMT3_MYTED|nr:unnamed protein product [Mytilus edulis]
MFVSIHSSKPIVDGIEYKVKQLTESFVDTSLRFVESPLYENLAYIGAIQKNETPFSLSFIPNKQRQSQVPVDLKSQATSLVHLYDIDMEGNELGGVTSVTMSVGNTLIFCDVNTKNVYFCLANDAYQSLMSFPYSPWNIQIIPETTTAVMSSKYKPYILFIDIIERSIIQKIEVKQSESGGIAASKDNIFVGTVGNIQVFDDNGYFEREIRLHHNHIAIKYICVCLNGNICYSVGHEVHCITPDGDPVFTYAAHNFRNARNIIIDNFDYIYVLGSESNNIHKLSTAGSLVDILLKDNVSDPLAFCFSNDWSKIYIADEDGEKMSVFKTNF